jgi:outer membrane phospholipase A
MTFPSFPGRGLACALGLFALAPAAWGQWSISVLEAAAQPGAPVTVRLVRTNATAAPETVVFKPAIPVRLTRSDASHLVQARREGGTAEESVTLAPGAFAERRYQVEIPAGGPGLQLLEFALPAKALLALRVEAEAPMVANGEVATHAVAAVTPDAAKAPATAQASAADGNAAPPAALASAAPATAPVHPTEMRDFDRETLETIRQSIYEYHPVYFNLGAAGGTNAKFQVSLKYRLFASPRQPRDRFMDHLYFGFTQLALWDLHSESRPFLDTNFRPAVFYYKPDLWTSANRSLQAGVEAGYEHESNGRDGDRSRSIDVAYVRPRFQWRAIPTGTVTIQPKLVHYIDREDNPDIANYRGYGELAVRVGMDDGWMFSTILRRGKQGKGSYELNYALPLRSISLGNLNGYLHFQYFHGYGESLISYNQRARPQLRMGLMVVR